MAFLELGETWGKEQVEVRQRRARLQGEGWVLREQVPTWSSLETKDLRHESVGVVDAIGGTEETRAPGDMGS